MADQGNTIGEVGGVIRTKLGLTRHSRTRSQIQGNVELYVLMNTYPDLGKASSDLAEIITQQTKHLRDVSLDTGRAWMWGPWALSWVVMAGSGYLVHLILGDLGGWWAISLSVIFALNAFLFFFVGLILLLQRKSTSDEIDHNLGNDPKEAVTDSTQNQ